MGVKENAKGAGVHVLKSFVKLIYFFVTYSCSTKNNLPATNHHNFKQETTYGNQVHSTLEKAGILTSFNDTKLARVTFENYDTRIPNEVTCGMYEWLNTPLI